MERTNRKEKETAYGFSRHFFVVSNSLSPMALSSDRQIFTTILLMFSRMAVSVITLPIQWNLFTIGFLFLSLSLSLALRCFMNGP